MTDKQFDSYKKRILRDLERIKAEADKKGDSYEVLDILIADLKEELQRP